MIGEKRNAIEFGGAPNDLSRTGSKVTHGGSPAAVAETTDHANRLVYN